MIKIEALIRPWKLDPVKEALIDMGVEGVTVTEVAGHNRQEEEASVFRGKEYRRTLIPKIKLEVVVLDDQVEEAVEAIAKAARTGEIGDGQIFVIPIQDAFRIRNGNQGIAAL
jgi:nitrogen regulatory protein P-II 1